MAIAILTRFLIVSELSRQVLSPVPRRRERRAGMARRTRPTSATSAVREQQAPTASAGTRSNARSSSHSCLPRGEHRGVWGFHQLCPRPQRRPNIRAAATSSGAASSPGSTSNVSARVGTVRVLGAWSPAFSR